MDLQQIKDQLKVSDDILSSLSSLNAGYIMELINSIDMSDEREVALISSIIENVLKPH